MKLSEQTIIEAQIGFYAGILLGALASAVFILGFTNLAWYFKLFSAIGEIGILGSLSLALWQLIQARKRYLETMAEMNKVNDEANEVIEATKEPEVKEFIKQVQGPEMEDNKK